jgi:hypothetical protein
MARRRRTRPPDPVELLLWLGMIVATVAMAALAIRPIWDMTAWLG